MATLTCGNSYCSTPISGDGPTPCKYMVIGEAPGEKEMELGLPFVGRAGKLLNELIELVGMERSNFYITNIVKCRPPGNKTPSKKEREVCGKTLPSEIALVQPQEVILLGEVAVKFFFPTSLPMKVLHGQRKNCSVDFPKLGFWCLDHPARALRDPKIKARLEEDWKRIFSGETYQAPTTRESKSDFHSSLWSYDAEFTPQGEFICGAYSGQEGRVYQISSVNEGYYLPPQIIVCHNLRADLPYLYHARGFEDTMLMAWCLGEEQLSLRELVKKYFNALIPAIEEVTNEV